MRALRIILLALAFISFQAHAKDGRNLVVKQNGSAGKRIALVIGNGNYQHPDSLPKLANPTHDAEDIAAALRGFGFEVIEKKDQSLEGMNDAIAEFGRKIGDSEAALFYFAGHGLQVKGQNYLVPVNANIESEAQVPYQSINVNQLLDEMDNGKSRANIVLLDACRNNPISGKFRSGATRGLAAITSQPKGTVIVYATDPGNVAADGDGRNGLFTAGLLTAFKGSDLSLGGVLTRASAEVERASQQKQTPYVNGPMTLQKNFQFGQGTPIASLVPAPAQPAARIKSHEEIEQETWESARDSGNIGAIQEYLKQYPKGRFTGQAKVLIATLKTAPAKPAEPIAQPAREDNETALWTEVQKGNSADDYNAYLSQYPKGKYIALARSRMKKLQDEAVAEANRKEQDAWEAAGKSGSEAGYQSYLKDWPAGRYAGLAQARLRKLQTDLAAARQKKLEEEAIQQAKQEREAAARQEAERQRQQAEAAQAKQKQEAERQRQQASEHVVSEQKVALVIGNSDYKSSPLKNPVNDARAMSAKLKELGFDVIAYENLQQKQLGKVLKEFRSRLQPGAVALFFYAGHGLQVKGVNYLPTVDADIESEDDVSLASLDVNKVFDVMAEAHTRLNLVFLDACRNNPYARSFRSAEKGLAKVDAPSGTLISFATRPGSVAADGSGQNGLYTEHLLKAMDTPDIPVEKLIKTVVSKVKKGSNGRQEPWMESSIEGDFYFRGGAQTAESIEKSVWKSIKDSTVPANFGSYLTIYPNGLFVNEAKEIKARLEKQAQEAELRRKAR